MLNYCNLIFINTFCFFFKLKRRKYNKGKVIKKDLTPAANYLFVVFFGSNVYLAYLNAYLFGHLNAFKFKIHLIFYLQDL